MPATLKNTFLSLLLLTVLASGVKANSTTTVTLFDYQYVSNGATPTTTTGSPQEPHNVSAIGLDKNGGTVYAGDKDAFTVLITMTATLPARYSSTVTVTETLSVPPTSLTFVEASSWMYVTVLDSSEVFDSGVEGNCTSGMNDTTGECIEISRDLEPRNRTTLITTTTFAAQPIPFATLTVTGPIPTSTNAAILGYSTFSRMTGVFLGTLFILNIVMLVV